MKAGRSILMVALLVGALTAPAAEAIHFYRGPGGGCQPASGEIGESQNPGPKEADVQLWHNTFADGSTLSPVTTIKAGGSITWTWNSAHCHSVTFADSATGLRYPSKEPSTPRVVQGFFDYPVLETDPGLSFTKTFTTPGRFTYSCDHHAAIGMVGVVIVEA